jgi:hypothetical protein
MTGLAMTGLAMKPRHGFLQAFATHKPHRVERPSVRVMAQAIDRHDARMLQAAGALGLKHEPQPRLLLAGIPFLDLL